MDEGVIEDSVIGREEAVVVNRISTTQVNPLNLETNSLNIYEDIMETDDDEQNNYGQEISESEIEKEIAFLRAEPSTFRRVENSAKAKASVIGQLYADMVHLPKLGETRDVPHNAHNMNKATRSASVQDSGATLLFNRTLLLFTQLHVWIGYLFGVVLPVTRSCASQLAPEAIVSNLDIVITYLIRVLCCMYLQMKLIVQEELTRWTSVFLCAVWESLMRLSVYR